MDNIPAVFGYCLGEKLGAGSIAAVYSGVHIKTGLKVAIKILKPSMLLNNSASKRFLKEVETVSNLNHPNIIRIFQFGYTDQYPYMIMEYFPVTLREKMENHDRPMSLTKKLGIIRTISHALEYAHDRGIIHRDIKPGNIMFRNGKSPVLVDFGLAKISGSEENLTRSGVTVGTPDYMSPEQIQGLSLKPASDIYSLGVVLYEILTGHAPYRATNYVSLAMKHLKKRVPRLPRKFKQIQPLLNRMMAKDIKKRYNRANEIIQILDKKPFIGNLSGS
jgi:serine/threonine protein kinase